VRVFTFEETSKLWEQRGGLIKHLAHGLTISSDGAVVSIVVPATKIDSRQYVVIYRFHDSSMSWIQLGGRINCSYYGNCYTAISSSESIVAIIHSLRVYTLDRNSNSWKYGEIIDNDYRFDSSVSMSSDGTIIAIGCARCDYYSGRVRTFTFNHDSLSWTLLGDDIVAEAVGDRFGVQVSLSSDGKVLACGATYNDGNGDNSGHVRVMKFQPSNDDNTSSSPPSMSPLCDDDMYPLRLELKTDRFPDETTWKIVDIDGTFMKASGPYADHFTMQKFVSFSPCLTL